MENSQEITHFGSNSNENAQNIEQFKDDKLAVPQTQPSVILKGGVEEIGIKKLTPKQIEQYLWMHPVVPRGIEIKANRMTTRGHRIEPFDDSPEAKTAAEDMKMLFKSSGDEILINGWIQDGYAFGNGYLTLLPDANTGEIVRLNKEHPIFFRIAREKKDAPATKKPGQMPDVSHGDWDSSYGNMKIDPVTKQPSAYTQVVFKYGDNIVEPTGKELRSDQVAHLIFDSWGDEAEGISLVQYVHLDLKYLMNIEEAAAEAIYRSGFTQKKVTTDIMNERDLKKLGKNLEDINSSDTMILPKGTDVENLVPGQTQFVDVHDKYLTLIAIRLGVPKPILTLDGTDTNKATMQQLMKDMIYDVHADELKIARTIEKQIFEPALKIKYGEDFEKFPLFKFNDFIDDKEEKATILESTARYIQSLSDTFLKLQAAGEEGAAKAIFNLLVENVPKIEMEQGIEDLPKYQPPKKPEVINGNELTNAQGNEPVIKEGVSKGGGFGAGNPKTKPSRVTPKV